MRSFLLGLAAAGLLWVSGASANDFTVCGESLKLPAGNEVTTETRTKADPIIGACTRLLQHPPKGFDSQGALVFRGYAWYVVHEYDKAIADYTSAINLNGASNNAFVAYRVRAAAWSDKNELDLAVADNQAALKLNPKAWDIHHNQANIYRLLKQPESALAELNQAIALNPAKFAESYNSRGVVRDELGQHDAALADFNEVIRLSPTAKPYAIRGNHWRLMGDLDKALQDQDTAVKLGDDEIAYFLRAETLRYRGDLERAMQDYDHFLTLHPIHVPAMVGRALVFEKMGNIAQAKAEFEKALNTETSFATAKIDAEPARETAGARLAAYASGNSQPVIPPAPVRVTSATSIPTPALVAPILQTPVKIPSTGSAAAQGRRVALVIGNSAYEKVPALANPQQDAEVVATSLRNIGFTTVTLAVNASREKLIAALRAFADEADKADWAVVYYAGHGIEVNGQNYLIPVDAVLKTDRDVQFETIALDQVMASIDGAKKLKLVILDACRDNPFAPEIKKTAVPDPVAAVSTAGGNVGTRSIGRGLGEVKVQGASLVVFAAKHGQTALDGDGGDSPFAVAMVQRIATPGVEINKIFRLVRDDVMEATAGRQEPYTYGSLPGKEDFFFVAAK